LALESFKRSKKLSRKNLFTKKNLFRIEKSRTYDFILALATIAILVILSLISVYGTVESWINSVKNPDWTSTWLYADYLNRMNMYAYPFVVALVLVLCMCIPKRFIPRDFLLEASIVMLAFSIAVSVVWGLVTGLAFLLIISALIQMAVVIMVISRSRRLIFEREGIMVQLGSALLHLGFVVFALDLLLIKNTQSHLDVFWLATALITLGSVLSFYSKEISTALKRISGARAVQEEETIADSAGFARD